MTKKILAILMALVLMLSMSAVAFADEIEDGEGSTDNTGSTTTTYVDASSVTITKVYKLANANTTSPAETFTVTQTGSKVVDGEATSAPALGTITGAEFSAGGATTNGAEANITITLPTYEKVGIYEYTLKETAGSTAGVTYFSNDIKLIVTVIEQDGKVRVATVHTETDGDVGKSDRIENTYTAGSLSVSKTVTGNLGDQEKYFEFKVTLTGENGKTYAESYTVSGGSDNTNPTTIKIGEVTTFRLKHDDTITIANLPYGVTYKVEETSAEGYTTTKTGDAGTIDSASQTASFTNDKTSRVDTGISMDSIPYIVLLAVAAFGIVALMMKKRYEA